MMLLRYRVSGERVSLSHITEVIRVADTVYFLPARADFLVLKVEHITDDRYSCLISELYQTGKTDVCDLQARTFYVLEDGE